MKSSVSICDDLIKNGIYFWDVNVETLEMEQSPELARIMGFGDRPASYNEVVDRIPFEYRYMYSYEYMKSHNRWSLPVEGSHGIKWFDVSKLNIFTNEQGETHCIGTIQLPESNADVEQESGIDAETIFSLIDLLPQLNENDTFYQGMHKTLLRIHAQMPHSTLVLMRYRDGHFYKCCDAVGHTLVDRTGNNVQNGTLLEVPYLHELCKRRKATACNDLYAEQFAASDVEMAFAERNDIKSFLSMPVVRDDGQLWGMVSIMRSTPTAWNKNDLNWIMMIAKLLARCIEQSEKNHSMKEQLEINRIACDIANLETWKWHDYGNGKRLMHVTYRDGIRVWPDNVSDRLHPADSKKYLDKRADIREGKTNVIEMVFRARQDANRRYEWIGIKGEVTERSADGKPLTVMGVAHNIDDKVKEEQIKKRQRSFQESIYEKLPVSIEVFDSNGILVYANRKTIEIYGTKDTRRKCIGSLNIFDSPLLNDSQKEKIRNLSNNDFYSTYNLQTSLNQFSRFNTSTREISLRVSKLFEAGKHKGYMMMMVDNSVLAEQRLRLSLFNKYWDTIGRFAQLGIFWTGEGENNFASGQWIVNFNLDQSKNIFDYNCYDKVNKEDLDLFTLLYNRLINNEINAIQQNMRVTHPDNSTHWISLNVVRNPAIGGIVGLSIDVTTLKTNEELLVKAREKAEKADLLKSQFLANMSHEIRTPLNAIVGFSSLLGEVETREERHQCIDIVQKNTDLLLALITDILDLSKIESGTLELSYSMNNINELCSDIYKSLKPHCPTGVHFIYEPNKLYSNLTIYCDLLRIKQVIMNLITNAFKFTQSGEVRLWFSVDNNRLGIHVSDTGIGIKAENLHSIFDSFVKLNPFAVGTGIGLSISRSIARQMGGDIEVESKEGRGSHFWLELPNINNDHLYWRDAIQWQRTIIVISENSDLVGFMSNCLNEYNVLQSEAVGFAQFWLEKRPPLTIIDARVFGRSTDGVIRSIHMQGPQHQVIVINPNHLEDVLEADTEIDIPLSAEEFLHVVNKYIL